MVLKPCVCVQRELKSANKASGTNINRSRLGRHLGRHTKLSPQIMTVTVRNCQTNSVCMTANVTLEESQWLLPDCSHSTAQNTFWVYDKYIYNSGWKPTNITNCMSNVDVDGHNIQMVNSNLNRCPSWWDKDAFILFLCGLFNDAFKISDYTESKERMITDYLIGKVLWAR